MTLKTLRYIYPNVKGTTKKWSPYFRFPNLSIVLPLKHTLPLRSEGAGSAWALGGHCWEGSSSFRGDSMGPEHTYSIRLRHWALGSEEPGREPGESGAGLIGPRSQARGGRASTSGGWRRCDCWHQDWLQALGFHVLDLPLDWGWRWEGSHSTEQPQLHP